MDENQYMLSERFDQELLTEELLFVATSLCGLAAIWQFFGHRAKAKFALEQASDLLTERARRLAIDFQPGLVLQ